MAAAFNIHEFLERCGGGDGGGRGGGWAVVDGGLATELERHGADLNDPLWSAKCLIHSPHLIRRVHLDYLEAGANIIISASYQATPQGFESKGLSRMEGEDLLRKSVQIAREAREIYNEQSTKGSWDVNIDHHSASAAQGIRRPILVAASVGSYGAYLADGSEYSGDYGEGITLEKLKDFHRRRVQILAESGADLIAFETIPNKLEAEAYAELLEEEGVALPVWFSFTSKDGVNASNGDPISECASVVESCKNAVAFGINCTAPRFIHGLILSIKKVTNKPIIIYPNSGETYNGHTKEWMPTTTGADDDFVSYVGKWREAGASLINGCCRTSPKTIRDITKSLSNKTS